jgi:hypothetical protein
VIAITGSMLLGFLIVLGVIAVVAFVDLMWKANKRYDEQRKKYQAFEQEVHEDLQRAKARMRWREGSATFEQSYTHRGIKPDGSAPTERVRSD